MIRGLGGPTTRGTSMVVIKGDHHGRNGALDVARHSPTTRGGRPVSDSIAVMNPTTRRAFSGYSMVSVSTPSRVYPVPPGGFHDAPGPVFNRRIPCHRIDFVFWNSIGVSILAGCVGVGGCARSRGSRTSRCRARRGSSRLVGRAVQRACVIRRSRSSTCRNIRPLIPSRAPGWSPSHAW